MLGEAWSRAGLSQTRIAETEKYAHVTYFFNGGEEKEFPHEERVLIPSLKVATYDLAPEMRAEAVAGQLERTTVINGDVLDQEILEECNAATTETVVAVTNDDETNILSSLLAKRHGCRRAITLINKGAYEPLVTTLGIDVVVSPRNITVSTILQHVRRGRIHSVHTLRDGFGELIEAEAMETSPLVGKPLSEVKLPAGVRVGAVVRGDEVITPGGGLVIQTKDRVILFAAQELVRKVEKMFSVQLEYF